jgi:hypothetical protein
MSLFRDSGQRKESVGLFTSLTKLFSGILLRPDAIPNSGSSCSANPGHYIFRVSLCLSTMVMTRRLKRPAGSHL